MKNKILLINPPRMNKIGVVREDRCAGLTPSSLYPPMKLSYMAGLLRKSFDVKILDCNALNLNLDEVMIEIKEFEPKIVIFTASPTTFSRDAEISNMCRAVNQDILVVLDDSHICPVFPERILKKFDSIDVLIREESIFIALEIANNVNSLNEVNGISYRQGNKIIHNLSRQPTDLDKLPLPAYDLLPIEKYTSVSCSRKKPFVSIMTSAGCPFKCDFCIIGGTTVNRGYGRWRTRSLEKVLDEIEYLHKKLGVKSIYFFDETFTISKEHVLAICGGLLERGIKIEWACNSRVDTTDEEMLGFMAKAGCWKICYGVESASEQILGKANKGYDINKVKEIFKATREAGIVASASFMIGLPGETQETANQTLELAKEIDPPKAQFVIATPYPGTKLYDYAKENNLLDKDYSFDSYDAYGKLGEPAMHTEKMTAQEIKNAQKRIQRKFYFRPKFIFKTLFHIKSFTELKNLIRAAGKI